MGAADFNYLITNVSGTLDLTEAIKDKLGHEVTIRALTAESDAALTFELSPPFPPDNPNAMTMFGGGPYKLHVASADEGMGMHGATRVTVRGTGVLKAGFWYDRRG